VVEVDLSEIGLLVEDIMAEAMVGVSEALTALEDVQIGLDLGEENCLTIADDDGEVVIDFGEIMADVSEALEAAFAELDSEDWAESRSRHGKRHRSTKITGNADELRQEIDQLERELAELQKQVRRIKNRQYR
jgi:hypothetical protein